MKPFLAILGIAFALAWVLDRAKRRWDFWHGPNLREQLDRWRGNGAVVLPKAQIPDIQQPTVRRKRLPRPRKPKENVKQFNRKKS